MEGVQVLPLEDVVDTADIFVTASGNMSLITAADMASMKHNAIVCNIGHFDNEIDMEGLARSGATRDELKPGTDVWKFDDGHQIIVLAEGRLVNLGCATGHPSFVMSCSFSNQVIAQIELFNNTEDYPLGVYVLPKHLDEKVARLHLDALGVKLTKLTDEQAAVPRPRPLRPVQAGELPLLSSAARPDPHETSFRGTRAVAPETLSHPSRTTGTMMFQSRCAGCDRVGPVLCRTCRFALAAPAGMPVGGDVVAAVPFAGRARTVLLGFKYGNRRQLAHHFAGLLVNRLLAEGVQPKDLDVITWAPTTRQRRHRRGFDQAELVARRVALQLGVPCRRLLERQNGAAQTGLDRATRLHGPVFRASPAAAGRRVLVIDDVITTGSTLRSAEAALRRADARSVQRAAVATTPAMVAASGFDPTRRHPSRHQPMVRRRPAPIRTVVQGPWAA